MSNTNTNTDTEPEEEAAAAREIIRKMAKKIKYIQGWKTLLFGIAVSAIISVLVYFVTYFIVEQYFPPSAYEKTLMKYVPWLFGLFGGLYLFINYLITIPEANRGLLKLLGKREENSEFQEGWHWIPGFIAGLIVENVREQSVVLESQRYLSEDNIPVEVGVRIQFKIVSLYAFTDVDDPRKPLASHIASAIRKLVNEKEAYKISQSEAKFKDEWGDTLFTGLLKEAVRWGIEIIAVYIENIRLPASVEKAAEEVQNMRFKASEEEVENKVFLAMAKKMKKDHAQLSDEFIFNLLQAQMDNAQRIIVDSSGDLTPLDRLGVLASHRKTDAPESTVVQEG